MFWIHLKIWLTRKIHHQFSFYFKRRDAKKLTKGEFAIISKNCWGGQLYQWLGLPYNTPFVGLFLFGPCYIKLLESFDAYLDKELTFVDRSKYETYLPEKYPIALLGDVEIHFQHYADEQEAKTKWDRRTARLKKIRDKDNLYFTICERRLTTPAIVKRFHALPFKNKLSFSTQTVSKPRSASHIQMYGPKKEGVIGFFNGKKLFKLTPLYVDIVHWLNTGNILKSSLSSRKT